MSLLLIIPHPDSLQVIVEHSLRGVGFMGVFLHGVFLHVGGLVLDFAHFFEASSLSPPHVTSRVLLRPCRSVGKILQSVFFRRARWDLNWVVTILSCHTGGYNLVATKDTCIDIQLTQIRRPRRFRTSLNVVVHFRLHYRKNISGR